MKLSAPKVVVWWIALVLAVVGLLTQLNVIPAFFPGMAYWVSLAGYVLLFLGTLLKGF